MFNEHAAKFTIQFVENLKHATGKWAGVPFKLFKWQYDIVSDVYGTMKKNNYRQYEYMYLEIPKKNGKTELAAALGLYHTYADGEINGEVYGCASEKGQASIAFDVAVDMVDQSPALKKITKYTSSKKLLKNTKTNTFYKVLSAEAYSKHGYKPSAVIFDELHAQPNRDLWDVMTFGAGDIRDQPIWIIITTAGDDPDRKSIGWEIHDKAVRIIDGDLTDKRWYCKIYGAKEDDDIWDEKVWYKVNPSLGCTIDIEKVRAAAESAKQNEAEEKLFRWLRLNQWVSLKTLSWLPLTIWDSTTKELPQLVGMKCYGGLDLSSTIDLTAFTLLFPPQIGLEYWYCIFYCWLPTENMKERVRKNGIPYDSWSRQKYLTLTPGNVVDYNYVESIITTASQQYEIVMIGSDPWNSRMLTTNLKNKAIEVTEVPQNMGGMSPAMKHIEKLFRSKQLFHEKNPVARWCFGNVVIAVDGNENIKPMKNKSYEKIDITVSMINAMAVAMEYEMESVYESRGIITL